MNAVLIVLIIPLLPQLSWTQRSGLDYKEIYPPPWSKQEVEEADDIEKNVLGYCGEENQRCGQTEHMGGMGGRWVYCCPGLWCSPDPKTSKDLYSITCTGTVKGQEDHCYYYEYAFKKNVCKKDGFYPPLPLDMQQSPKDPRKPTLADENLKG